MKKRKLTTIVLYLITLASLALGMGTVGLADSSPLSVKAVLPENQYNKNISYYHLLMKPGTTQEIDLQLFNSSAEDVTAVVTLTAATTNDNGLIDYNLPEKELNKSLLYAFPTIATTPKEVTIPANQEVITKIAIAMPVEEYQGMILGGINVKVKKAEQAAEEKEAAGGMKIENQINYAIGVVLVENDDLVTTDMTLERVYASQVTGINTTKVNLQNPTTAVMEDVTIEAKVYAKGSDTFLYEAKKAGYRMAPNSDFDFGVPLGNERYQAGDYTLKVTAISNPKNPRDGEKQEWAFEKDFSIKRQEASKLNETAVDLPTDYQLYYLIAGVGLVVVILILVVVVKRKRDEKRKASRKAKSKKK